MARRRSTSDDLERDDDFIASLAAPVRPAPLVSPGLISPEGFLNEIEDRRTFDPEGPVRTIFNTGGLVAGYRSQPRSAQNRNRVAIVHHQPSFDAPKEALICVRRKTRREVIFAKRKRKKGAGAGRRRRNFFSNVRC